MGLNYGCHLDKLVFSCRVKPQVKGIIQHKDLPEIQWRNQSDTGGGFTSGYTTKFLADHQVYLRVDFRSHRESISKTTWSGPTHPCQAKKSSLSRLHLKSIGNQISMVIVVLAATEFQFAILMVFFISSFFWGIRDQHPILPIQST